MALEPNTVLPAGASTKDPVEAVLAMQVEIAELRAFHTILTPAVTPGVATGKKARVHTHGDPTEPKTVIT